MQIHHGFIERVLTSKHPNDWKFRVNDLQQDENIKT